MVASACLEKKFQILAAFSDCPGTVSSFCELMPALEANRT
jgi:hypothetical protein